MLRFLKRKLSLSQKQSSVFWDLTENDGSEFLLEKDIVVV